MARAPHDAGEPGPDTGRKEGPFRCTATTPGSCRALPAASPVAATRGRRRPGALPPAPAGVDARSIIRRCDVEDPRFEALTKLISLPVPPAVVCLLRCRASP